MISPVCCKDVGKDAAPAVARSLFNTCSNADNPSRRLARPRWLQADTWPSVPLITACNRFGKTAPLNPGKKKSKKNFKKTAEKRTVTGTVMDFQGWEMLLHNFLLLQHGDGIRGIDCRSRKQLNTQRPGSRPGEHVPHQRPLQAVSPKIVPPPSLLMLW